MLPLDTKRSKNHFHKKCTCFTSKKTKVAIFFRKYFSKVGHISSDDSKKSYSKELKLAQS